MEVGGKIGSSQNVDPEVRKNSEKKKYEIPAPKIRKKRLENYKNGHFGLFLHICDNFFVFLGTDQLGVGDCFFFRYFRDSGVFVVGARPRRVAILDS